MSLRSVFLLLACLFAANAALAACTSKSIVTEDPDFADYESSGVNYGYLGCKIEFNGSTYCHLSQGGGLSNTGCKDVCADLDSGKIRAINAHVDEPCTMAAMKVYLKTDNRGGEVVLKNN